MKNYVYFRDKLTPQDDANVSVSSSLAQYGLNVFEGIRAYANTLEDQLFIFRLKDHVERLLRSAKLLRFEVPESFSVESIMTCVRDLIIANELKDDSYIRVTLFVDNDSGWSSSSPVSLIINCSPKGRSFTDITGLSCNVSSWKRISDTSFPPRIKAGPNYLNSRLALLDAKQGGYDYPIMLNEASNVAEGPGACLFIVRDKCLVTPSVNSSILESITRDTIIDIAKRKFSYDVVERTVDRTELYIADEVFFVGTAIEVKPVHSIDGISINGGFTGSFFNSLHEAYFRIVRGCESYEDWLYPIYANNEG